MMGLTIPAGWWRWRQKSASHPRVVFLIVTDAEELVSFACGYFREMQLVITPHPEALRLRFDFFPFSLVGFLLPPGGRKEAEAEVASERRAKKENPNRK